MRPPKIDLGSAVVAVTEAARGIGRSTAELFARHRATVCLGDLDVETLVRRLIGDDKALTAVDSSGRAACTERITRQTAEQS